MSIFGRKAQREAEEAQRAADEAMRREQQRQAERQRQIADVKSQIESTQHRVVQLSADTSDAIARIEEVLRYRGKLSVDAALVEPRSTGERTPKPVGLYTSSGKLRSTLDFAIRNAAVSLAADRPKLQQTVIDRGTFKILEDRASFIGSQQQRTWEFKNLTGFDTDDESTLLMAVSNRQKISGVRYDSAHDAYIDASFLCAVEFYRGNEAAANEWANREIESLRSCLQVQSEQATSLVGQLNAELAALNPQWASR